MPVQGGFAPTTAQGFNNYVNIIRRNFSPNLIYQNVRKSKPFLRFLLSNCSRPREGGLSPITQPVSMTTFGFTPQYADFSGDFTSQPISNPVINAEWNQALAITPIDSLMTEISLASNELAMIDIVKARYADTLQSAFDFMSSAFLGTQGTNTLAFNGLQDAVDNGTVMATYGNLIRSNYPKWNSSVFTNNQTGAAYLQVLYYISSFMQDNNAPLPTMGITSWGVFHALATSFNATLERMIVMDPGGMSSDREYKVSAVEIGGIPIVVDPNITTAQIFYINPEHLFFDVNSSFNFKITEPASLVPIGQLGWRQALTMSGQFYTDMPSAHFLLNNAPTVTLA